MQGSYMESDLQIIIKVYLGGRPFKSWGTPFSFAVLSSLLCFLKIFPFILFCLDPSTIYLSYPSTIFRSYGAPIAGSTLRFDRRGRINWSDFFFDSLWFIKQHLRCDAANHPPHPQKAVLYKTALHQQALCL